MDQTRARRALEAVMITGLCGSQAGVPETKRTAHLQVWPFKRLPNLFMDLQAEDSASRGSELRRSTPKHPANCAPARRRFVLMVMRYREAHWSYAVRVGYVCLMCAPVGIQ